MDFKEESRRVFDYMVYARRELHRRPCLTDDEGETASFIISQLKLMGIPYHADEKNNVVGKISDRAGKRLALRADTDALPINEDTGLPFASEKPGVMHACGHDFHVANLLGTAKALTENKDELCGTVYLCFQAGEEQSKHASDVVAYLKREGGVDGCFGLHVNPGAKTGVIQAKQGALMAGCSLFTVEVSGKGGHGSSPWLCADPVKPACDILLKIAAAPVLRFSAFESVVISPCAINAGSAGNVIPDKAYINGNFRYFKSGMYGEITRVLEDISESSAKACGVKSRLILPDDHSPPMINDAVSVKRLESAVNRQGIIFETIAEPWMASDNFAEYLDKFGGAYCFGGVTKEGDSPRPIHTAGFNPDEAALSVFCETFLAYTHAFLTE